MMFCPACGTLNEDASKFCGGCGNRLIPEEPAVFAVEPVIAEPVIAEPVIAEPVIAEPVVEVIPEEKILCQPVHQPPVLPRKQKDKGLVWGIISLVLGAGSVLCCGCPGVGLIAAVAAVILGCVGIIISRRCGRVNGLAVAGLACGGVGVLLGAVSLVIGLCMSAGMFVGMMEPQPSPYHPY